ncbi:11306_t:CDS:2 [Paraglomus occultum]|uniref:11306_t:CDS:1 n=1 Tax=Paraglomus occultum TaxID=144539 RepID=A0A9N8Z391_9GLOM|nr:11306_t:CDS:2 [Paraglomus occultum]
MADNMSIMSNHVPMQSAVSSQAGSPVLSPRNRPPTSSYLKRHKSVKFAYLSGETSFQKGILGDSETSLVGILEINYSQPRHVKSILLNLRGVEKTIWYKAQARTKSMHLGEQVLVDQTYKIWEESDDKLVKSIDVPFRVKLPYNLPESVTSEIGTVSYVLKATITRKGGLTTNNTQIVEIVCPLKRTLVLDNQNSPPFKLRGESRNGLDYTFVLPPNKQLNLGTYVTVPMRIRFLKPGISVERVEIVLKTCMDFRCSNPSETRHCKEQAAALVIPRQEMHYLQPVSNQYEGECVHTINLFIPRSVQPTYSGRFISITHQLCIKFCLWGADSDVSVEESVRVANIVEKHRTDIPQSAQPPPLPKSPRIPAQAHSQMVSQALMYQSPRTYLNVGGVNSVVGMNNVPGVNNHQYSYVEQQSVVDSDEFHNKPERYFSVYSDQDSPRSRRPSAVSNETSSPPPPFPYDGLVAAPKAPTVPPPMPPQMKVPHSPRVGPRNVPRSGTPLPKHAPSLPSYMTTFSPPPYQQPPPPGHHYMDEVSYVYDFTE